MTDPDLLAKKLAFVESCVADLRRLAVVETLDSDIKERRFVERTLQLAIQACLDAASHVVSDDRLGEPRTNQQLFTLIRGNVALRWTVAADRRASRCRLTQALVRGALFNVASFRFSSHRGLA